LLFLLLSAVESCPSLRAASFSVDWFTIDGGGQTSTGGVYAVTGAIGQPEAGTMSGGNFTVAGGFWGMATAVQPPEAPLLAINYSNSGAVLSWPAGTSSFLLESATILTPTPVWSVVSPAPVTLNGVNYVTNSVAAGNRFYRLRTR
jgi:hypothetical protein